MIGQTSLASLPALPGYTRHRITSCDTTGGNAGFCRIEAGEKRTLREIDGTGCIKHFRMTLAIPQDDYCRRIIIRMFWDDCPVGVFLRWGMACVRISLLRRFR